MEFETDLTTIFVKETNRKYFIRLFLYIFVLHIYFFTKTHFCCYFYDNNDTFLFYS